MMRRSIPSLFAFVLLLPLLPASAVKPKPPEAGREGLPAPGYLSPILRELLHKRMERHSTDMGALVSSVVLLKYDDVIRNAEHIATEPRVARPLPGDMDGLNAQLPPRFFTLQEELHRRARELTEAARAKNDAALGKSFGLLTEACVACHSAYKTGPGPK